MIDRIDSIPQELKRLKQWVCFVLVYRENKGKYYKIPKDPNTGNNAKCNDSSTWSDFETAVNAVPKYNFDGIGIEFANGIFGIDLDNVIKNNTLTDEAREIVNMVDSYTEYSPSGKGLHILCKGTLPKKGKRKGSIEMYSEGRFFTVTGNIFENRNKLEQRTEQAKIVYDKYLKDEPRKAYKDTVKRNLANHNLSDNEIIKIASEATNGNLFKALWNGDTSGYSSQSEAEQALANILAFYSGGDFNRIDSLMKKSGLYREKWDRRDYKTATINRAISGCKEFYGEKQNLKINQNSNTLPSYVYQKKDKYFINCPMLAKHIRENTNYFFVKDSAKSTVMRYFYENGVYKLYSDDMVKGVIKNYITKFDENILKMSDIKEVFNDLTTDLVFTDYEKINANENIINFQNGLLDIKTMRLLPHSPKYYSTIQIPCNWSNEATQTPIFDRFTSTLLNNDKDIKRLLLQFIGVCLSNIKGYRMKKALFMVGSGDTGKSQLKSLTEKLLGKGNYCGIDLKELESRFGTSNIYNKRLAGSSDMSYVTIEELKTFKKCTGGDSLFAKFKGENGFEFVYNGLLWFCMNKLPKFGGDNGTWVHDRIIQIECNNVIPKEKQDKYLLKKMYKEREGIVRKAIGALLEVISNGYEFSEPKSVVKARENYRTKNSTIASFFEECVVLRPDNFVDECTTQRMYQVYKAWCKDNNHGYSKTAKEFRQGISEKLGGTFEEVTIIKKGYRYYKSVTLSLECKKLYFYAYGSDCVGNSCENWNTS